ncbi:hypothetical protein [Terricaulis sp.]|uniref:hypothetical protein n=1 Tax=Terricaulis sp. TaxID=2768686 RepID=UPI0037841DA8
MTFADFFAHYWWLMFPVFGMVMAIMGMFQSERQQRTMIDLIKSYTDQGKEPPPELLKLASQSLQAEAQKQSTSSSNADSRAWSFITFAALAGGFGTGYYFVRAEEWAWAFLIVAVTMGVMAAGALFILLFGRKS